MAKWVAALANQARKARRNQQKLRKEFLEQRLRDSVSGMEPDEQQEAIETIIKRDKMRQIHRIIQRRSKRARTQLKCVIGEDGQRISGSAMTNAFVTYNAHHFQQPIRNRATAVDGGDFAKVFEHTKPQTTICQTILMIYYKGRLQNPTSKNLKYHSTTASSVLPNQSLQSAKRSRSVTSNDTRPPS